jgi:hypothetical protein
MRARSIHNIHRWEDNDLNSKKMYPGNIEYLLFDRQKLFLFKIKANEKPI